MKLAIVGAAGGVGGAAALALAAEPAVEELLLVDPDAARLATLVLDLEPIYERLLPGRLRIAEAEEIVSADIAVVAASVPHRDGPARLEYLRENEEIVAEATRPLDGDGTWPGRLLLVTNPVDQLCTSLVRRSSLRRSQVLGYTLNDSARLRSAIAAELGVAPARVDAWMAGEHGTHAVPLFSRVRVDGRPVALAAATRAAVERRMAAWYRRWQATRPGRTPSATTAVGVARMVRALASGDGRPTVASVLLEGEYGLRDVSVGVPVSFRGASTEVLEWPLAPDELDGLERAADAVAEAVAA